MGLMSGIGAGLGAVSGYLGYKGQKEANKANANLTREMARHGVKMRVLDAQEAGIHPLAALGANITQAAPSQVGADPGQIIERAVQGYNDAKMQDAVIKEKKDTSRVAASVVGRNRAEEQESKVRAAYTGTQIKAMETEMAHGS